MSEYRLFKSTERRVARMLGGQRTGYLGGADETESWFAVEVEERKEVPAWLKAAMAQAKRNAGPPGAQLPLLVIHEAGERHAQALVVMELGAFVDWFGNDPMAGASNAELRVLAPDLLAELQERGSA